MSRFGTFWQGPSLSAFEAACLHTFVVDGHEVTLFSYELVANVPAGVRCADANEIADRRMTEAFLERGVPSPTHFSDYFRYRMFEHSELTWIDSDLVLLQGWEQDPNDTLLAFETDSSLNPAVMRVPGHEPWLQALIRGTDALRDQAMRWGETGPRLLTRTVEERALAHPVRPPEVHFPIHYDEFWKPFLPEHAAECRERCARALTLHLWNNLIDQLGYWKEYLPPAGSFLNEVFTARGCGPYFRGEFPLRNMRHLVRNWQARQTGQLLGIGAVLRQLVPSVQRTYRHYRG